MKTGDFFMARTHADFLNKAFKTNYKSWMKAVWNYDENSVIWMVRFDGITRNGWRNVILNDNEIFEENVDGMSNDKNSEDFYKYKYRIAVEVIGQSGFRKYVFKGLFAYNEEKSIMHKKHYYKKLSDNF